MEKGQETSSPRHLRQAAILQYTVRSQNNPLLALNDCEEKLKAKANYAIESWMEKETVVADECLADFFGK